MSQITLGKYLFERLKQVNCNTIFGLPGDFNLSLLDKIYEVEGMRWAGNCNELNAAYAADGYARVKGLGCIITTFGVGELSALNGIAGAYAEHVGVLHVVGCPSTSSQAKNLLLHHTLGNGDFTVFHRMSANISETTAMVTDLATAPAEIDRLIRATFISQRTTYLGLPANLVDLMVPGKLLNTPIDLDLKPNDAEAETEVVNTILELIGAAKNPIILADACASRHDVRPELKELIDVTQFPSFVTPLGKGTIDEQHSRYGGVYVGTLTQPEVKEAVENADLILSVGALLSDFNTGSFSYSYKTNNVVEFHSDYIKIRNGSFPGVQMKFALQKIISKIKPVVAKYSPVAIPKHENGNPKVPDSSLLKQEWLWNQLGEFLKEGDVILTETGTAAFGINQTHFPSNAMGISQVLWGSIGYSVGACVGAAFAANEIDPEKRVILFVGDGSLQLTVQEISTLIKWNLTPYLFVLNNNGYTIEKLIHGPKAEYNQIQPWKHQQLLKTFGATEETSESMEIRTVGEWNKIAACEKFNRNDKIRLIEVFLPEMDAPNSLILQAKLTEATNAKP